MRVVVRVWSWPCVRQRSWLDVPRVDTITPDVLLGMAMVAGVLLMHQLRDDAYLSLCQLSRKVMACHACLLAPS